MRSKVPSRRRAGLAPAELSRCKDCGLGRESIEWAADMVHIVTASQGTLGSLSGDGENSAPESLAERREDLFPSGDEVGPEKGNTAGGFTDPGADHKSVIGRPHPIGCKCKRGGKSEGFLRGQLQRHGWRKSL
jgi:hypothetical protein